VGDAAVAQPTTIPFTGLVRALEPIGDNVLEIDVTNLWVNRQIGDAALPETQRLTKTNVALHAGGPALKPYQGFHSTDPLLPSGLSAPCSSSSAPAATSHSAESDARQRADHGKRDWSRARCQSPFRPTVFTRRAKVRGRAR
jgi:hypothetical protein